MAKKIQIRYWDDEENLLGTYTTDDEHTSEEVSKWEEWLNDNAVEAPGAPEGWTQFDLAPVGNRELDVTTITGFERPLIITEGMVNGSTGRRIYGAFRSEMDARSSNADNLALAIIGEDKLTPKQIDLASRNSERLSD